MLEARAAAALVHPAVAQVYDIDEVDGVTFIAMEFVDGRTVSQLISQGELDLMAAVEIGLQIAGGLARAHETHILHRDIKSDNIMVASDGHAKLLDFGLAKLMESGRDVFGSAGDAAQTVTQKQALTIAGAVMGTICYMSPEQARGRDLDVRSDIFSLGIVLYEMVAGELPFKGETPIDTMHAIAFEEAKPVTVVRRNIPPEIHRIISRCLRKRPEDRYPNAQALATDLERVKRDLESGTRASLPVGEKIREWFYRVKSALPFETKRLVVPVLILVLAALLLLEKVAWWALLSGGIVTLFFYRFVRNRKRRLLKRFINKVSRLPNVKAVLVQGNRVIVVAEEAQAGLYLRVTSLIDGINKKLYFGRHVTAEVQAALADEDLQTMLRQTGVMYVRNDILLKSPPPKCNP